MSNVLIGIIGVILFIGLALAGALILGDDFRSASTSSQAAALMSQLKQTADAADMRKLKLGTSQTPSTETDFLVPRFLKTKAVNPTSWAQANPGLYMARVEFNNNIYGDAGAEPGVAALYLQAVVGPVADAKSRDTCQAINDAYGITSIPDFTSTLFPVPTPPTGCILTNSVNGQMFIAYQRMENASMSVSTPYTGP